MNNHSNILLQSKEFKTMSTTSDPFMDTPNLRLKNRLSRGSSDKLVERFNEAQTRSNIRKPREVSSTEVGNNLSKPSMPMLSRPSEPSKAHGEGLGEDLQALTKTSDLALCILSTHAGIDLSRRNAKYLENSKGKVIHLCGVVTYAKYNPKDRSRVFKILLSDRSEKRVHVDSKIYCPVEYGDNISAHVILNEEQKYYLAYPPFIQAGTSKGAIVEAFVKALRGKGIGPMKADRLYDRILDDVEQSKELVASKIDDIARIYFEDKDMSILDLYSENIDSNQMKELLTWWHRKRMVRRLHIMGLTDGDIKKCGRYSMEELYERLRSNPYTILPLSISKCNEVLGLLGKDLDPEQYRCAEISRKIYNYNEQSGWTGVPVTRIRRIFADLPVYMNSLIGEYRGVVDSDIFYFSYPYEVETTMARILGNLAMEDLNVEGWDGSRYKCPGQRAKADINEPLYVRSTLSSDQKEAITNALNHEISIITGPAGSGKSTVIAEIVYNLDIHDKTYLACSFTGRAVSRIREVLGKEGPITLHRLKGKASSMTKKLDYLIIDEASMVTSELLYQVLKGISRATGSMPRLLFIGDNNQLPTITWGNLFQEMINSNSISISRLVNNHRVVDGFARNGIIINCYRILNSDEPIYEDDGSIVPFHLLETENFQIIEGSISKVRDIVLALSRAGIKADKLIITCPYNCFIEELNNIVQEIYTEGAKEVIDGSGKRWIMGDRVMMQENNYEHDLMNGDVGYITGVCDTQIEVTFETYTESRGSQRIFDLHYTKDSKDLSDAEIAEMTDEELVEQRKKKKNLTVKVLKVGWASTVHKVQGSEYDYEVAFCPSHKANSHFLTRNLCYTMISRAKIGEYLVGDIEAFTLGCQRSLPYRCDLLGTRIGDYIASESERCRGSVEYIEEIREFRDQRGRLIEYNSDEADEADLAEFL